MDFLVKVTLPSTTGLVEDDVQNTLAYAGPIAPVAAWFTAVANAIRDFYNAIPAGAPGFGDVADRLSGVLSRATNACRVDFYEIPATPGNMGSPHSTRSFTLGAANAVTNLPNEVAVVGSMNADVSSVPENAPGDIRPRARRRGRIFIGPLNADALATSGGGTAVQRPRNQFLDIVRHSMRERLAIQVQGDNAILSVFSRADWTLRPVVAVSTDNAFDTQRRRGEAPTARTTIAI